MNPDDGRQWRANGDSAALYATKNINLKPEHLSTGERVIFSMLTLAFADRKGSLPPKLVLLDEIDATLHPSMIKAMLLLIERVFLKYGAKVILATHSPTTLALVPDESIFVVQKERGEELLKKATKAEALEALTEGYATVQDLIKFTDTDRDYVVISEGRNCRFLEKACEFFDPNNTIEILDLKNFGTNQLREIFKFMQFVNKTKKFVFVWDCDYRQKEQRNADRNIQYNKETREPLYEVRNLADLLRNDDPYNRAFVFEHNGNSQSARGIENLFNTADTQDLDVTFDHKGPTNKPHFERRVLDQASEDTFANFKPLFDFIEEGRIRE